MMTQTEATRSDARATTAAGWYPDPASSAQVRWWDGAGWTEHLRAAPESQLPEPTPEPERAFVGGTGDLRAPALQFQTAPGDDPIVTPSSLMGARQSAWVPASAALNPTTPFVWIVAVTPLLNLGFQLVLLPLVRGGATGSLIAAGLIIVLLVLVVSSGVRDQKALIKRGFDDAPTPSWILLTPLVYLAIRTIRVKRVSGRGTAPLWTHLASIVVVVVFAAGIVGLLIMSRAGGTAAVSSTGPTAPIQSMMQSDYISQGITTIAVACPEIADLSAGATFDCSILDAAHPESVGTGHVLIGPDGKTFTYTVEAGVGN